MIENSLTDSHNRRQDQALREKGAEAAAAPRAQEKKPVKRTPGLKLFDVFLYPVLTNITVFAVSVAATYLTVHGSDRNGGTKPLYGKTGLWFQKRGEWLREQLKHVGIRKHNTAEMAKMVGFSFLDGSIMAPFVWALELQREKIGRWIDNRLGKKPEDEDAAYKAEPKQTWKSVLGGRVATFAVVVPTATLLEKIPLHAKNENGIREKMNLNDFMFRKWGGKTGKWLQEKPGAVQFFKKLKVPKENIPGLMKVVFFETFYTSVCTAGLYVFSRMLASRRRRKQEAAAEITAHTPEVQPYQSSGTSPPPREWTREYASRRTETHAEQARRSREQQESLAMTSL
jgi:hypothetical protein